MSHSISEPVVVGQGPLGIDALIRISVHGAQVCLTEDSAWVARMATYAARVAKAVAEGGGLPGRPAIRSMVATVRGLGPGLEDDRPLDADIEAVYQSVVAGPLGQRVEAGG